MCNLILSILQRLNKEKAALQTTAELLTVRLNSVNEILALQEEKMVKKVGFLFFLNLQSQTWYKTVFKTSGDQQQSNVKPADTYDFVLSLRMFADHVR